MRKYSKFKIVITGGGTGGHIYPAIAVAQQLKADSDIAKIYYIGCAKNMEKSIAEKESLEFYSINASGMPRKISFKFITWLIELFIAILKSLFYLIKLKPDLTFGTGGYVTAPVLIASKLLLIPVVIHEPDAHPGIVNRAMSKVANVVSLAFEDAKSFISNKNIIVNGNPIRESLSAIEKNDALQKLGLSSDKRTLLVIGGSQGARTINIAISEAIPYLIENFDIQIIHQTGKKNYESYVSELYKKYPELAESQSYIVQPYFDSMEVVLNAADLAISRAGSLSLSELSLCGLPSILVPYPFAAADHQQHNAAAMEKNGAAIVIDDSECNSENLIKLIDKLINTPGMLKNMQDANRNLSKPEATKDIVKVIKNIASDK